MERNLYLYYITFHGKIFIYSTVLNLFYNDRNSNFFINNKININMCRAFLSVLTIFIYIVESKTDNVRIRND